MIFLCKCCGRVHCYSALVECSDIVLLSKPLCEGDKSPVCWIFTEMAPSLIQSISCYVRGSVVCPSDGTWNRMDWRLQIQRKIPKIKKNTTNTFFFICDKFSFQFLTFGNFLVLVPLYTHVILGLFTGLITFNKIVFIKIKYD